MGKREDGMFDSAALQWRRQGSECSLWADGLSRPVMQGHFVDCELRPGLSLHGTSVVFDRALTGQGEIPAGLKLIVMLEGEACACIGKNSVALGGPDAGCVLLAASAPTPFRRIVPQACTQRQVVLTLGAEWLEQSGLAALADDLPLARLADTALACRSSQAPAALRQLAERLLASHEAASPWLRLQQESWALELLLAALPALAGKVTEAPVADARARQRIARLLDCLHAGDAEGKSLAELAREFGTNPTTLQKQFRSQTGRSIADYLRHYRLEMARRQLQQGMPVTAVALEVGYSSPANFATACKRAFGVTPRELARMG